MTTSKLHWFDEDQSDEEELEELEDNASWLGRGLASTLRLQMIEEGYRSSRIGRSVHNIAWRPHA